MNWWQWTLLAATVWAVLAAYVCRWNYRIWNPAQPVVLLACTGCQRHHVRSDCPVHGGGA